MAYLDTTQNAPIARFPSGYRKRRSGEAFPNFRQQETAPARFPEVNPLPMPAERLPGSAPASPPAAAGGPEKLPADTADSPLPGRTRRYNDRTGLYEIVDTPGLPAGFDTFVERPKVLTDVEKLLTSRLGSRLEDDPRYQSRLTDLAKSQDLRKQQRIEDLKRIGILKDEGPGFSAFDTLSEIENREKLLLASEIENLRRADVQDALTLAGQQGAFSQQDIANTLSGFALSNQMVNDAITRAIAQGEQTSEYIDPQTGESYETLMSMAQKESRKTAQAQRDLAILETMGEVPPQTEFYNLLPGQKTEAARATRARERFTEAGLTGDLDGRTTLPARETTLQEELGRGELALRGRAQTEEERRARRGEELRLTELVGTTTTGQKTLTAIGQEAEIGLRDRAQDLAERIQTGQLSIAQAEQELNAEVQRGRLTIDQASQILNQAQVFGRAGTITPGTLTEAARATREGERLSGVRVDLEARRIAQADRALTLEEEQQYGGKFITENGARKWQPTLAYESMDRDQKYRYSVLSEETRRARQSEKLALADRLGWTDAAPGKVSWNEWAQAFRDFQAGKPYDVAMDLNGDGRVDFQDMEYGQEADLIAAPGETFTTLEAKQLQSQINATADALKLDRDKLNEGIRQFNASLSRQDREFVTKATGYVYDTENKPVSRKETVWSMPFSRQDYWDFNQALSNSPTGSITLLDVNLNTALTAFDLNEDGKVTREEFLEAQQRAVPEGGAYRIAKGERWTPVSTLEREQFKDDQDRFNRTFDQGVKQFLAQIGIKEKELEEMDDATKSNLIGTLASAVGSFLGLWLGRKKKD
jgi:hypothetical protein